MTDVQFDNTGFRGGGSGPPVFEQLGFTREQSSNRQTVRGGNVKGNSLFLGSWNPPKGLPGTSKLSRTFEEAVWQQIFRKFQESETPSIARIPQPLLSTGLIFSNWLAEVQKELAQVDDEADEDGIERPSESAKEVAGIVLQKLAEFPWLTTRPIVYPADDSEVAIQFQDRSTRSAVLILCEQEGGIACHCIFDGKKKRARSDDEPEKLVDDFVRPQLRRLSGIWRG